MIGIRGFKRLVVVTGKAQAGWVAAQLAGIDTEFTVLLEPAARDSAPAMAAAACWIASQDEDAVAVFAASDHHIPDAVMFVAAADTAVQAARSGSIVTLGIKPSSPNTAYGYIRPSAAHSGSTAVPVAAFVEKPDGATAQRYITEGYLWNSGNFITLATTLIGELTAYAPDVAVKVREAVIAAVPGPQGLILGNAFRDAPKLSIDYAVMEKSARVSVLPTALVWTDLGAWDQVRDVLAKDANGNAVEGATVLVDTHESLIRAGPGLAVVAIGLRNIAIVAERDAVLVCDLDHSQSVKHAVNRLQLLKWPQTDVTGEAMIADLHGNARCFKAWLFTAALPVWWSLGGDHAGWGFHESLDPKGGATTEPRRVRVQARQAHAYAVAGRMGWKGPWMAAYNHANAALVSKYLRQDGLFRGLVSGEGTVLDDAPKLYDQAFVLLALASGQSMRPQCRAEADALLDTIEAKARHVTGGFREFGTEPFLANPHMHLLESAIAWTEEGGGPRWHALASELVDLALSHLIDAEHGFIRESYDAQWTPLRNDAGRRIEPGHQFEWCWLLERWARLSGNARVSDAAHRLYEAGHRGVDPARGVALDQIKDDFTIEDFRARLWPQTERLKAALLLSERADPSGRARLERHAMEACAALRRYLGVETSGLWYDKFMADETFVVEPAPASTLYHLISAVEQLQATTSGGSSTSRGAPNA